jgi:uncharacterized membrane protein
MNWIIASIHALAFLGFSDLFRKLASTSRDPFFVNLVFQSAAFLTALILFLMNKKMIASPKEIGFAVIGGILISLATAYSMRALAIGPGLSTVMPIIRFGGLAITALLGIIILREKISIQTIFGFFFAIIGIYLLFNHKS